MFSITSGVSLAAIQAGNPKLFAHTRRVLREWSHRANPEPERRGSSSNANSLYQANQSPWGEKGLPHPKRDFGGIGIQYSRGGLAPSSIPELYRASGITIMVVVVNLMLRFQR